MTNQLDINPIVSKKKADTISNGVFLVGLGILFFTDAWWPGILVAVWASIGLRQYLTGRIYDLIASSAILLGLFIISILNFNFSYLIPILLVVGGIYLIFREFFFAEDTNGEDKSQEILDDSDVDGKNSKS